MTEQTDDAIVLEEAKRSIAGLPPAKHAGHNSMISAQIQRSDLAPSTARTFNDVPDQLSAMRGIATSVCLSVPLWVAIGLVIWMI
jgi:hypothetical protein